MLRAAFLDVGQGDTTMVWNPDTKQAIVVDCINAVAIWDLLKREQIKHIPAVIATHLHTDHYGQLIEFLDGCQQRGIHWDTVYLHWWPNTSRQTFRMFSDDTDQHSGAEEPNSNLHTKKKRSLYQNLASWLHRVAFNQVKELHQIGDLSIDGIRVEFLHPFYKDIGVLQASGKLNNTSAVLRVSDGDASILLTGDLEPGGWEVLTSQHSKDSLTSDVLKFPHHGGWKDVDVTSFLDQIAPQVVIMSVGTSGYARYKHPNLHVFEALERFPDIQVLCTQVTPQCCPDDIRNESTSIRALLNAPASQYKGLALRRGCPCASTIVIELTDRVKICYPLPETHRKIINHWSLARCYKKTGATG